MIIDGSSIALYEPVQLELARAGGVTAINHTVTRPEADWAAATQQLRAAQDWIDANPDDLALVRTVDDLQHCKDTGRLGIIFGPQDSHFLGGDINRLSAAYDAGLRVMQLTYQNRNCVGDGCGVVDAGPLTDFGRDVVRGMNQLGIVVDLSHVSIATGWSALEVSTEPIVYTHAHAEKVTPHPRSKPDDQIRAVASTGGVIGVSAASSLAQRIPGVQPDLDDFFFHIDYLVDLVGVDHVGIGLDFDQSNSRERYESWHRAHPELDVNGHMFPFDEVHVKGLSDLSCWPVIEQGLADRGVSAADSAALIGGNWHRVFGQIWGARQ